MTYLLRSSGYDMPEIKRGTFMPNLNQEQKNQNQYVSVEDYCAKIDKMENFEEMLKFTTNYILSYGQDETLTPDYPISQIIKVAHMKLADKSASMKFFYQETDVNRGIAETMVDPTVSHIGKDLPNKLFISNPVAYLKGAADAKVAEIKAKSWKDNNDIATMLNCTRLSRDVFTDELNAEVVKHIKNPKMFDMKARLEHAFGGPKGLKKAYDATKPGVFSSMFGTRSVAAANLDQVYNAFFKPNHALYGDMNSLAGAAKGYLQHVFPGWKPSGVQPVPTQEQLATLKGTRKARALLSVNLLLAVKAQREMEDNYLETIAEAEKQNLTYDYAISNAEKPGIIVASNQSVSEFQSEVNESVKEEEEEVDIYADPEKEENAPEESVDLE